ncbi:MULTISPECIES: hypothetical protein [unclassified Chryseobacterium]|uniref:hypothetical protein n=1 Tax=unclassified Chryseobacterium TaxID=2593645 RepID=UPI000D337FE1|nr:MULTISPECIES: hypothetical protein [unclassified Chryseobacterium]PTT70509.1 hypothetical protein DBR25_18215 [Chryseobacterium sp. HMWF001]PVV61821.1 hypothetical protein DD829_01065 [Chryseobacterium sp. HMWF035]
MIGLPFSQNSKLEYSLLSNDANLVVSYGFNSVGKGALSINAFKKPVNLDFEFTNVELPIKATPSDENGLITTLDFDDKYLTSSSRTIKILSLNQIQVSNTTLINSNPKFSLIGNHNYQLSSPEPLENVYFIIPKPKDSYLSTFIAFMTIAIFIGIFSSIKLLKGKTQSIFGGIVGILLLAYLGYLMFSKIIPEDFTKDIDMISLIGGGIGLCIGVVLNSAYNLITIYAIERQQSGG